MSDDRTRRYVVAYDIPDDRRRQRVARKLESYGDRVQFSVFLVEVKPARFVRLRASLERLLQVEDDSLLIVDTGPTRGNADARLEFVGRGAQVIRDRAIIL
ncbi:MAG: CRISPR-associated endonuclease Cas2 [Chloroflexota bacterium]